VIALLLFKSFFSNKSKAEELLSNEKIIKAKSIMLPFVLRRQKSQVLQQLPKKLNKVEFIQLPERQMTLYDTILKEGRNEYKKDGKKLQNIFMQLRKAANHPCLLREFYTTDKLKDMSNLIVHEIEYMESDPGFVFEDMEVMSDFELSMLCQNHKTLKNFQMPIEYVMDSGKIQYLSKLLPQLQARGDRVLIFSQFTMVLDILESALKHLKYKYQRLDGQTPVSERQELIDRFNESDEYFIFLLSTKAGGFGINLAGANVVIIHDIDFNPHNDKQAEDRAHRVGQTRDVTVIKLIAKDTLDESIHQLAQRKLELDENLSKSGDSEKKIETKDLEELKEKVFGVSKNK